MAPLTPEEPKGCGMAPLTAETSLAFPVRAHNDVAIAGTGSSAESSATFIRQIFRRFDQERNGLIRKDMLSRVFRCLCPSLGQPRDQNWTRVLAACDVDLDSEFVDYGKFIDKLFNITSRLFLSHQHTNQSVVVRESLLHSCIIGSVKVSYPPFNGRLGVQLPYNSIVFNLPCYGVKLPRAIMRLFETEEMRGLSELLGIPLPKYSLDSFVQKKMPRVVALCEVASQRSDCASGQNQEAVDRVRRFADDFAKINSEAICSPEDWQKFVEGHVSPGWEDNLHFDHILSSLFGFEEKTALDLRAFVYKYEDKGEQKEDALENHSIRWLAKGFKGYGPVGCLTDVVNLIYAMAGLDPPDVADERMIVEVVETFKEKLDNEDFEALWIPTHIFHDAESDDNLCWLLLEHIHRLKNTELQVVVQLPEGDNFNSLESMISAFDVRRYRAFRDTDSGNAKNVKAAWPF